MPTLNAKGEAAWRRFKQHMEWCDSFGLVFLFSDQPLLTRVFRDRLAAIHRSRVTHLEIPHPDSPDALLSQLLPRLLNPPSYQRALNAPIWLDLTRVPAVVADDGDAVALWSKARLQFLARLNEQREPLRHALVKPLILVVPMTEKAGIRSLCPDLWAIRHFTLEMGGWSEVDGPSGRVAEGRAIESGLPPRRFPLTAGETAMVLEWERLVAKGRWGRGEWLAADRALSALLRRGHLAEAREIAVWMLDRAREAMDSKPQTPESLRDLSISLDRVGDVDRALGEQESARGSFVESLEIRRGLVERLGETPESLRDLSISLDRVGDVDRALGELESARALWQEGHEIAQRLAQALPHYTDYRDLDRWFRECLLDLGK